MAAKFLRTLENWHAPRSLCLFITTTNNIQKTKFKKEQKIPPPKPNLPSQTPRRTPYLNHYKSLRKFHDSVVWKYIRELLFVRNAQTK
jgi:hypothetical protein